LAAQLLARERNLILGSLIALAVAAWAIVIWQASTMDTDAMSMTMGTGEPKAAMGLMKTDGADGMVSSSVMAAGGVSDMGDNATQNQQMTETMPSLEGKHSESNGMPMGLTMNRSAALFIGVWVAMMVAMMFPTSAPMILAFAQIQGTRQTRGQVVVPSWIFLLAYIALWSATGFLAYVVASLADNLANHSHWLLANSGRIGGAVLLVAGLYQLSPWKNKCLAQCRTPMSFIMTRWKEGTGGAIRMGLEHGAYCLGCCWLLFVILFPLGMMNVAAMAMITVVIFAEKSLAIGQRVAQAAAIALVAYGGLVLLLLPNALPTNITV
jgi:predicted metal-binding membrane protein